MNLKDCPEYDAIIDLKDQQGISFADETCPNAGLNRQRQLNWYIKVIDYYTLQLNNLGHTFTRKVGTYHEWNETIQTLLWFSRVLPQKEGDLFE